jgi:para-nitrobenzyl esterase
MWVNFARTGDPSTGDHECTPYDPVKRDTMVLGSDIHMESDIKAAQRKVIEPILHHYFNGEYMQISFNVPQTYRIAGLLAVLIAAVIALIMHH